MFTLSVPSWLKPANAGWFVHHFGRPPTIRRNLAALAQINPKKLPEFVQISEVAMRYLRLLGSLDWEHVPKHEDLRFAPDVQALPHLPFVAACLVKIDQHLPYMADLHQYLVDNPALVWVLGFPLKPSNKVPWGLMFKPACQLIAISAVCCAYSQTMFCSFC